MLICYTKITKIGPKNGQEFLDKEEKKLSNMKPFIELESTTRHKKQV